MNAQPRHSSHASELDTGPRTHERERLCLATRTVRPISELIRFVINPQGEAVPDLKHKLPGRGVWVTATHDALGDAIRHKLFARGFKRQVCTPTDLVTRTEGLLERAALDALAIVGKAGRVATGFAKIEALSQQQGQIVAILHAVEASPDGIRKLDGALRRRPKDSPIVVVQTLTSGQLDLALGRTNVVHAALLAGPASDTFLARLRRLERFRAGDRAKAGGENPSN